MIYPIPIPLIYPIFGPPVVLSKSRVKLLLQSESGYFNIGGLAYMTDHLHDLYEM